MTIVIHENEFPYYNANKSKNIKLTKLNSKENEEGYFKRNKNEKKSTILGKNSVVGCCTKVVNKN